MQDKFCKDKFYEEDLCIKRIQLEDGDKGSSYNKQTRRFMENKKPINV